MLDCTVQVAKMNLIVDFWEGHLGGTTVRWKLTKDYIDGTFASTVVQPMNYFIIRKIIVIELSGALVLSFHAVYEKKKVHCLIAPLCLTARGEKLGKRKKEK